MENPKTRKKKQKIDMEVAMIRRVSHNGGAGAIDLEHSGGVGAEMVAKVPRVSNMEKSMVKTNPSYSTRKQEVNELESAKAEMDEVSQENQRLKMFLEKIVKDYRTLQMQFQDIVQKEPKGTREDTTHNDHDEIEESELVSLSLGRSSGDPKKDAVKKLTEPCQEENDQALVLGSTAERLANASSPSNSSEVPKEYARETWPPSKVLKTTRSTGDDEVSQQNPAKKARVSVRAKCDTPTMNDGCQWRKYGQKIAKGNPCPRAYYRCTIAPSCPVRKQVQRCAEDMAILITTYEGKHNHPLPLSATAMASTTSAAASMLLSGSSSSQPSFFPSHTAVASALDGANFYLSHGTKPKPYYLSNTSVSSSSAFPTITLDLTSTPSSSSSSQFNRFSGSSLFNPAIYSSASLNFNTTEANTISLSNGLLGYGNSQPSNVNRALPGTNIGGQSVETTYSPFMHKINASVPQQSLYPDAITVATKAITSDPSFQSALAVALSSMVGAGGIKGSTSLGNQISGEHISQKLKWSELFPAASTLPSTSKVNGCASTLLNKPSSTNSQPGSLMFLRPPSSSLPFPSSNGASASSNCNSRDGAN